MIVDKENTPSNLGCFLRIITPFVQSQFLPKSEMRNLHSLWHPWEREKVEFFRLEYLLECFDEWSAYGAVVPIVMNDEETLVQYYVPYLSTIQIFASLLSVNRLREEAEAGVFETRDSSSDICSEENDSNKSWRSDGCSSDDGGFEQHNAWRPNKRLGHLSLQYFEKSAPYTRVPLTDKISELARRYPGLKSLRSIDLSLASWMAVAWYPIYHIPMGRTTKDLSTCFLTYHTLSSSFQNMGTEEDMGCRNGKAKSKEREGRLSLPSFGLATYKMQGNVLVSGKSCWRGGGGGSRDQERLTSLLSGADSWLKQLMVQHHDFNYFTGVRPC